MPVVAVVAGIAGAAAGAATFSLAAGFTLANVAAGMAIVGGVSTALGAVTGNKKLMKFGAVVGLGGAALGGLSSLTGGATSGAAPSATALTDTALGGIGSQAAGAIPANLYGAPTGLLGSAAPSLSASAAPAMPALANSLSAAPPPSIDPMALGKVAKEAPKSLMENLAQKVNLNDISAPVNPDGIINKATGMLSDFGGYLGKNPELTKIGLGALSSMSESKAAEEQLEMRQRQLDADRARFNASIINQSAKF